MRTLLVLLALLVAQPAWATTYYLSPSGSDSNSGLSSGAPKFTLGDVLNDYDLNGGDVVEWACGTYAYEITWYGGNDSGTSWASAITMRAATDGCATVAPPAGSNFAYSTRASASGSGDAPAYIIWDGINFNGGGSNTQYDVVKITAWDGSFDPADGPAHHIRFRDGRIYSSITVGGTHQCILTTWGSVGVELIDMEIDTCGGSGSPNSQCIYGAANDMLFDGVNVHNCGGSGGSCLSNLNSYIGLHVSNHIIRNSKFHDCVGPGINLGEGSGHYIYNTLVYDNGSDGIAISNESCNACVQIYNNTVVGNGRWGIWIQGGGNYISITVKNNISYNNASTNFLDEGTTTIASNNSTSGTNPQFTNLAGDDYSLSASSPGSIVNAGADLSAFFSDDYIGTARPQGASWDIGAYEYISSTGPTVTITSPTSAATYVTTASTLALSGTASDASSTISSCVWASDRTVSGSASGTTSWSIASVTLFSGQNVITVTCTNNVSQSGSDTITVTVPVASYRLRIRVP